MSSAEFADEQDPSQTESSEKPSLELSKSTLGYRYPSSAAEDTRSDHEEYQYINLIRYILSDGESRPDRTGTGTARRPLLEPARKSPPQEMIDRQFARPPAQQDQQHRGPLDMCRPRLRIDEDFDHRGHAEQHERAGAGQQAQDEQKWGRQLYGRRHVSSKLRGRRRSS